MFRLSRPAADAWVGAAAIAVLGATLLGTGPAGASVSEILSPQTSELDNGLRIYTLHDPQATMVSFQVWYGVGTRYERPGQTGMAHFFEHLMFRGSESFAEDEHRARIEATGGVAAAYTTWDATVFTQTVPPDQLELCARLEADRMRNLRFDQATFEEQRAAIRLERSAQVEQQPIAQGLVELYRLAYPDHPYGWPTLGERRDLEALTLRGLQDFYEHFYRPDRAWILVSGPVPAREVKKIVERYFKDLEPSEKEVVEPSPAAAQTAEARGTIDGRTRVPIVFVGYRTPPRSDPDAHVLEIIARILSTSERSRLETALVAEEQIALVVGGRSQPLRDPSLLYLYAAARPEVESDRLEASLFREIDVLATDGPTSHELARAKLDAEMEFLTEIESIGGRAEVLGLALAGTGSTEDATARIERIRSITAEDIQHVTARYLVESGRTVVWLNPIEGGDS